MIDRVAAHFLTGEGPRPYRQRHPSVQGRTTIRPPTRPGGTAPRSSRPDRTSSAIVVGVRARSQRDHGARHQADVRHRAVAVPARARRAVGAGLLGRPPARARPAAPDGRVRAEPVSGSNRAITTCWSTSSRTPAARSGSWCRSWSSPGGKASAWPRSRRSSSSATASSRSIASATPRWRCCRRRGATSRRCGPAGNPRRSIARSFRAVPELLEFVNDAFTEMSQPEARRGTSSPTARQRPFPRQPVERRAPRPGARHRGGGRSGRLRRAGAPEDRASAARGDRPRSQHRRGAPGHAGRHRDPLPLARQPSRVRAWRSSASASRPTSTRGWASSTPTRPRTSSR